MVAARMSLPPPTSPCIGVCQIEPRTGLCLGCARSMDEIAGWLAMSPEAKRAVLAALPARRSALRRGTASALMLVAALALGACAAPESAWTHPERAPAAARQDLSACRNEATTATRREADIDADIEASRGQDWQRSGILTTKRETAAEGRRRSFDSYVARCMAARGWRRPG